MPQPLLGMLSCPSTERFVWEKKSGWGQNTAFREARAPSCLWWWLLVTMTFLASPHLSVSGYGGWITIPSARQIREEKNKSRAEPSGASLFPSPALCVKPAPTHSATLGFWGMCLCVSRGPPGWGERLPRGGRARVLLNLGTSPQGALLRAPAVDFPGVAASPTDTKYSCRGEGGATSGRPPQVIEQRLQTQAAARKRDAQTPRLSEAGRQDNGTHGRAARRLLPEPPSSGTVEAGTGGGGPSVASTVYYSQAFGARRTGSLLQVVRSASLPSPRSPKTAPGS